MDMNSMDDISKLPKEAFKYACWEDSAEHRRQLDEIRIIAQQNIGKQPDILNRIEGAIRRGIHSRNLKDQLAKKFNSGLSTEDLTDWTKKVSADDPFIIHDLKIALKKHIERQVNRAGKNSRTAISSPSYSPSISYVNVDNAHPNSLRSLEPSEHWQVVIDETGQYFNPDDMESLTPGDKQVGKVIALVIPEKVVLPALKDNFHATDETDSMVETAIGHIVDQPVGILGFSSKHQSFTPHSWMAAIAQLIRGVMHLLPIKESEATYVEFNIEHRSKFTSLTSLDALRDDIESELKRLAPLRFSKLHMSLKLIEKDGHKANGYVDAIANLWGSPSENRRKLLARTRFRDHCLISQPADNIDHILLALNSKDSLSDQQWYDLCEYSSKETEHSLANQFLSELGEHCKNNSDQWGQYADAVRQYLHTKKTSQKGLAAALQWLQKYTPVTDSLDLSLQLEFKLSQLALKNHQGYVDEELMKNTLVLSDQLMDEQAQVSCQAILRIASGNTNVFDFTSITPYIEWWLEQPIAVAGLLNYGKLHSSLGQSQAFQGDFIKAQASFEMALEQFERLSSREQKQRNTQQTQVYLAITLLEQNSSAAPFLIKSLVTQSMSMAKGEEKKIQRFARSGDNYQFVHHLFLRGCIMQPLLMSDEIKHYLSQQNLWQTGDGHPWMLIQAYRGWLLLRSGDFNAASVCFTDAIYACFDQNQGSVVQWMGIVIEALALSLGVKLNISSDDHARAKKVLANIPQNAFVNIPWGNITKWEGVEDDKQRLELLNSCLPFNFH
mgnify:CR=1 FL=1